MLFTIHYRLQLPTYPYLITTNSSVAQNWRNNKMEAVWVKNVPSVVLIKHRSNMGWLVNQCLCYYCWVTGSKQPFCWVIFYPLVLGCLCGVLTLGDKTVEYHTLKTSTNLALIGLVGFSMECMLLSFKEYTFYFLYVGHTCKHPCIEIYIFITD